MTAYKCPRCGNTSYSASESAPCPYCKESDIKRYARYERTTRWIGLITVLLMILTLAYNARFM